MIWLIRANWRGRSGKGNVCQSHKNQWQSYSGNDNKRRIPLYFTVIAKIYQCLFRMPKRFNQHNAKDTTGRDNKDLSKIFFTAFNHNIEDIASHCLDDNNQIIKGSNQVKSWSQRLTWQSSDHRNIIKLNLGFCNHFRPFIGRGGGFKKGDAVKDVEIAKGGDKLVVLVAHWWCALYLPLLSSSSLTMTASFLKLSNHNFSGPLFPGPCWWLIDSTDWLSSSLTLYGQ